MTPKQRERERVANRERMRRKLKDPEYRKTVNQRRRQRDQERRKTDPGFGQSARDRQSKYYSKMKNNPDWWEPRKKYFKRWKEERQLNEEFESFIERMKKEEGVLQNE